MLSLYSIKHWGQKDEVDTAPGIQDIYDMNNTMLCQFDFGGQALQGKFVILNINQLYLELMNE